MLGWRDGQIPRPAPLAALRVCQPQQRARWQQSQMQGSRVVHVCVAGEGSLKGAAAGRGSSAEDGAKARHRVVGRVRADAVGVDNWFGV